MTTQICTEVHSIKNSFREFIRKNAWSHWHHIHGLGSSVDPKALKMSPSSVHAYVCTHTDNSGKSKNVFLKSKST